MILGMLGMLGMLGGLAGCGGASSKPRAPSTQAAFADSKPVTATALSLVPADASLVVIVDRIDRLAGELGWDEVARLQPGAYARAQASMDEIFGHDLLDPGKLGEVGLDATRPGGLAFLDPETLVLLLPLADPGRFEATVMRQAPLWNQEVNAEVVGSARVLGPPYEDAWRMVLRDRTALWIIAASDAQARAAAARLATLDAGGSLARNAAFGRAMDGLGFGADVAGYVSGALLATAAADAVEHLGLEAGAPVTFGLDLGREGIRARAVVPVRVDGLLERLLRTPGSTPALLGTLARRPQALLDAVIDGQTLAELPLAAELGAGFEAMTGLSVSGDVAPLLAGEIGVAVLARDGDSAGPPDVHALVELREPAQGQALLERAMTGGALAGGAKALGNGAYRIGLPGGLGVHVGVSGRYLYASTAWSPDALPALGTGSAPALAKALASETLEALLLGPGQASVRASIDTQLVAGWYLPAAIRTSFLDTLAEDEQGYQPSEAYKRKRAELEAVEAELVTRETASLMGAAQRIRAVFEAVGTLGLRVDQGQGRLVIHAAEVAGPGGLPAALGLMLDAMTATDEAEPAEAEAAAQLRERIWELTQELEEIRRKEGHRPPPREPREPIEPGASPEPEPPAPGQQ